MRFPNRLTATGVKAIRTSVATMVDHPVLSSFLVAFGVRFVVIVVTGLFHDGVVIPDEGQYLTLALVASEGRLDASFWAGYGISLFESTRTFMWPLTALFRIFGPSRLIGQLLVAIFGAATASLSAGLAGRLWRPHIALGTGLLVAVFPSQVLWSSVVLREAHIWAGLAAIALVVDWSRRRNSTSRILVSTLSLGLLYIFVLKLRDQTAFLALWCLIPAFLFGCKKMPVRLPCAIFLLVFVPWIVGQGPGGSDFAQNALNRLGSSRGYMSLGADSAFTDTSMGLNSAYYASADGSGSDSSDSLLSPEGDASADGSGSDSSGSLLSPEGIVYRLHDASGHLIGEFPIPGACEGDSATGDTAGRLLDRPTGDWLCIYDHVNYPDGFVLVDNRIATSLWRVPVGLLDTMIRPLPWEDNKSPDRFAAGLESILWMALYGLAIYGVWFHRDRYRLLLFPILLVLSIGLGGAVSHGNLGTAFRHRGQILFALAVLAMGGVQAIVDVRRRKRPNKGVDLVSHQDLAGED